MIEGIDIANFGSFKGFRWESVRDAGNNRVPFKSLNILFGRNYSGKTTLSQIMRSLETGALPANYTNPAFTVHTNAGNITQAQVDGTKRNVRVFNRAFIDQHLSFLRRSDGSIDAFAVFGAENQDTAERIAAITRQLGSVDDKAGLVKEHADAIANQLQAQGDAETAEQTLEALLTKKATNPPDGIKHRSDMFGDVNYNKTKLKEDIAAAKTSKNPLLDEADARNLPILVRENALPIYEGRVELKSNFPEIAAMAPGLVSRRITPSAPLQELLNDSVLQGWVEAGMRIHRGQRTSCGFCQQPLPPDLWTKLDAHFNAEVQRLSEEVAYCLRLIEEELEALDSLHVVPTGAVYAVHRDKLAKLTEELNAAAINHRSTLKLMADALRLRARNLFDAGPVPATPNHGNVVAAKAEDINGVVAASNNTTTRLDRLKLESRRRLLLNEVAKFAADIQYEDAAANVAALRLRAEQLQTTERTLGQSVENLKEEVLRLRERQRDERLAAQRVNELLHKYFGHQALRLEAVQAEAAAPFKFRIVREGSSGVAHNLSEGECSLVAFCYFLAKLEDPDTQGKQPVIWIDDPISSLDANHIFFLFSLLESQLAFPRTNAAGAKMFAYEQIFISTHSLEFLKYLGKLSRQGKQSDHLRYFLVARRAQGSVVEVMPEHLQRFTTEFNFLFGEIYMCTDSANDATHHHCFYGFGNNLRRFLEAYLFFKYPSQGENGLGDFDHRLAQFFGGGSTEEALVSRLANEGSHLGGAIDKAMLPDDRDEIARVAKYVLAKMKATDEDQYACLLKSIGKTCPL